MVFHIKKLTDGQIGCVEWFWYHGAGWVQKRNHWCAYTRRAQEHDKRGNTHWTPGWQTIIFGRVYGCWYVTKEKRYG